MDKYEITKRLMECFPGGCLTAQGEFIVDRQANEYFILDDCKTEFEVCCKVLEWLSRGACKAEPFNTARHNDELHRFIRRGINAYLGTEFTHEDMELIYENLGNQVNRRLTINFVASGYNLEELKGANHDNRND